MKQTTIAKIVQRKDCYGYFWKLTNGKYDFQNTNDLGLMLDDWADDPVTIVRKIKCGKGTIYQIRNKPGCVYEPDEYTPGWTLPCIVASLKDCYSFQETLTPRELKLLAKIRC